MGADPPDAYEEYAQRYADPDDTEITNSHRGFPSRQYIGWPAVQRLLPDVSGRRVLDAGCGDGETVEWLLERGATVTGVDASRTTAEQAYRNIYENTGEKADIALVDLRDRLPFTDEAFDIVVCQLVLSHLDDLDHTFAEFNRVLTDGGTIVVTQAHPFAEFYQNPKLESYFDTGVQQRENYGTEIDYYRRTLAQVLNSLAAAGFALDRVVEPTPQEELAEMNSDGYERATTVPALLCLRAQKAA